MTAEEVLEQLIEDYKRRIVTIKCMMDENVDKMKYSRLQAKYSCYRTFLSELTKIQSSNY